MVLYKTFYAFRMNRFLVRISYLEAKLNFSVRITGIEDFDWEEFYILGLGNKREYEMLKKTQPSYTDIFSITGLILIMNYNRRRYRSFVPGTAICCD